MSSSAAPHLLRTSRIVSLLIIALLAVGCGSNEGGKSGGDDSANATTTNTTTTTTNTTTNSANRTTTSNTGVPISNSNAINTGGNGNRSAEYMYRNYGNGNGNTSTGNAQNSNSNAGAAGETPTRDEISEQLHNLPWGEIARDIPREMRVGEPAPVRVYIAKRIANNPSSGVPAGTQVSKVKLAPVMGAFLVCADADAFEITHVFPKDKDVQGVGGDQTTEWIWSVKPLKSGNYKLEVRATVELVIPGHENQLVTQTVFSEGVTVRVNPFYSAKQIVKDYWYIITALILTPLGWFINRRWSAAK
jgi:hypothetical protein